VACACVHVCVWGGLWWAAFLPPICYGREAVFHGRRQRPLRTVTGDCGTSVGYEFLSLFYKKEIDMAREVSDGDAEGGSKVRLSNGCVLGLEPGPIRPRPSALGPLADEPAGLELRLREPSLFPVPPLV